MKSFWEDTFSETVSGRKILEIRYKYDLNFLSISFINLYSKESTKANQEASKMSEETPTVDHDCKPSELSIKTRTLEAVVDLESNTRTL